MPDASQVSCSLLQFAHLNPERVASLSYTGLPPTSLYPEGIKSFSPGLSAGDYPGSSSLRIPNAVGVESTPSPASLQIDPLRIAVRIRPRCPPIPRTPGIARKQTAQGSPPKCLYPEGIKSLSPGLSAGDYPGSSSLRIPNAVGVESNPSSASLQIDPLYASQFALGRAAHPSHAPPGLRGNKLPTGLPPTSLYPEGIKSFSPGLSAGDYPGSSSLRIPNAVGVESTPSPASLQIDPLYASQFALGRAAHPSHAPPGLRGNKLPRVRLPNVFIPKGLNHSAPGCPPGTTRGPRPSESPTL